MEINCVYDLYVALRENNFELPTSCFDVWHYTTEEGIMGILKDQKIRLWFTRSDCLNDTSEGEHFYPLFQSACKELKDKKEIDEDFYEKIVNVKLPDSRLITFDLPSKNKDEVNLNISSVKYNAYICCFSKNANSLDMWRYYGKYNLCFTTYMFNDSPPHKELPLEKTKFAEFQKVKIIYENSEKIDFFKKHLCNGYSLYKKDNNDLKEIQGFIKEMFNRVRFVFKHECFESEKEYRVILYNPVEKPEKMVQPLHEVKYRKSNAMTCPYIEFEISDYESEYCLQKVNLSPFTKDSSAVSLMEDYIRKQGFNNVIVEHSKLPVR